MNSKERKQCHATANKRQCRNLEINSLTLETNFNKITLYLLYRKCGNSHSNLRWEYFTITAKPSRAHWLIVVVDNRTDKCIYNLCDAATTKSGQIDKLLL